MLNFKLVKTETVEKMLGCFINDEEYQEFGVYLNQFNQELQFLALQMIRNPEGNLGLLLAKQTFLFAMFCRDNIELIKDLISTVDFEFIDKERMQEIRQEGLIEEEYTD